MNRRRFLQAIPVAATAGLAGCAGGSGDGGSSGSGGDGGSGGSEDAGGSGGSDDGATGGGGEGDARSDDGSGDATSAFDGYLSDANNVGGVVDMTGEDEVTIEVGAGSQGYAFGPAAARVSAGTTVVWEWTGLGGSHNVETEADGPASFSSEYASGEGSTFEQTLSDPGVLKYYCAPHRGLGMKGVVEVIE